MRLLRACQHGSLGIFHRHMDAGGHRSVTPNGNALFAGRAVLKPIPVPCVLPFVFKDAFRSLSVPSKGVRDARGLNDPRIGKNLA